MPRYHTSIISREIIAKGTMLFTIKKSENFTFKAGQHLNIEIFNPPTIDNKGTIRPFSIASAPHEHVLTVATRISDSAFKKYISTTSLPVAVDIEGPLGSFTLHKDITKPAVFLAGGIGITPFRSIIQSALNEGVARQLTLLYSNRTPNDAPFLTEFEMLARKNKIFTFIPTMSDITTHQQEEVWRGATGYIDWALINKNIQDPSNAVFYVAGPPGFVKAMFNMLLAKKVSNDAIRSEEFSGY